jgi:hypothetical protein
LDKFDHINQFTTLSVIPLSGDDCRKRLALIEEVLGYHDHHKEYFFFPRSNLIVIN